MTGDAWTPTTLSRKDLIRSNRELRASREMAWQRVQRLETALTLILAPHGQDISERIRDIAESALKEVKSA